MFVLWKHSLEYINVYICLRYWLLMENISKRDNEGTLSDPLTNNIRDGGNGSCEITLDKKWLELHGYYVGDQLKIWARKINPIEKKEGK